MLYRNIIRPILFLIPPERIHLGLAKLGQFVASLPMIGFFLRSQLFIGDRRLTVRYKNITFFNPIGLAAGYDKDGISIRFNEMFGFGFMEVGSITALPYAGNPKPRLRRLPKNHSLIVSYGLKGDGADKVYHRLVGKKFRIPVGISVAKSNLPEITGQKAINDYVKVFEMFHNIGDYYTINISCPNTYDGMPFTDPEKLERLLQAITKSKIAKNISKPIFLKINPDLPHEIVDHIINLVQQYRIDGLVIGNLFKNTKQVTRLLKFSNEYNPEWPGSISGEPIRSVSTELIRYVYKKTNGQLFIIGCGGVFTGEDAYEKICAGASIIQLITGLIYNGPFIIRNINKRLIELLESDGYQSINQAIGKDLNNI